MKKVLLFAGTRKGGIIFTSDESHREWTWSDLHFKAWNVMHMRMDPRDSRLHVAAVHEVFGPSTHYSDDLGETWVQAVKSPVFEAPSEAARPIGTPDEVNFVESLPKTRSGKIMRRVLKAVAARQGLGDLSTLEDEASVEDVKRAYERLRGDV